MSFLFENVKLFSGLSIEEQRSVEGQLRHARFEKQQIIFSAGEKASTLFVVKKGKVKLFRARKGSAKEETVCVIGHSGYFCLAPLLSREKLHISARALEETELFKVDKECLETLICQSHTFAKNIIRALAQKECELCEEVCDLSLTTTKERLAQYLLKMGREKPSFTLPLNQSELASHLGTVRETLARDLSSFKKAGIIQVQSQKIRILKPDELKFLSQCLSPFEVI